MENNIKEIYKLFIIVYDFICVFRFNKHLNKIISLSIKTKDYNCTFFPYFLFFFPIRD